MGMTSNERRKRACNKYGCKVSEDMCVEHDEPLVCVHGCSEVKPHECIQVHSVDGGYVVAISHVWFPGVYVTEFAARRAATVLDDATARRLQDARGFDAITDADVEGAIQDAKKAGT